MKPLHSLLQRQLKRHALELAQLAPEAQSFVAAVDAAYHQADEDRAMLERSLELSSHELLQANSEMRAIFAALPEVFFRLDRSGRILDYKAGRNSDFNFTPQALVGKRIDELPDEKIRAKFLVAMQQVNSGQSLVSLEFALLCDEREVYYEARLLPLFENQIVVVVRNISARKQAEMSLENSNSLLRATLEATINGILVVNREGAIVSYNQQFVEMWRIPAAVMEARDDGRALAFVLDQLQAPEVFLSKVQELYNQPEAESFDVLNFKDGRIFERYSAPQKINGESAGRVWSFLDVTDRKRAEAQVVASLHEKETLLKEIHHRVKNNLQIISSLLSLQGGYIKDEKILTLFKESEHRVRSMALIHEKLYQSENLSRVNFAEYLSHLTSGLLRSYGAAAHGVKLQQRVEDIFLGVDTAIPCGLLVNELVSNALKHAFVGRDSGEIQLELHRKPQPDGAAPAQGQRFLLTVRDNGVGFPHEINLREARTLGLKLVAALVRQLNGVLTHQQDRGTVLQIEFSHLEKEL